MIPCTVKCQCMSQVICDTFSSVVSTWVDEAHDCRKWPGCAQRLALKAILLSAVYNLCFLSLILATFTYF